MSFASRIALALGLFAGTACSQDPASISLADGGSGYAAQLYIAVHNTPSTTDPDAYKLMMATDLALDEKSVSFCFDALAACQGGTAMSVPGVATTLGTVKIFASEKFVKLSNNLTVTVLAKTTAGQAVSQSIRINTKGAAQQPPATGATNTGATTTGTTTQPPAGTGDCIEAPDAFTCQAEAEVFKIVNAERQKAGLNQLTLDQKVSWVARWWSVEQSKSGNIGHEAFENGSLKQQYVAKFNAQPPINAENVAMTGNCGDAASLAKELMDMWMNSQGHRENILRQGITLIGVGIAKSGNGCYGTQDFGSN